MKIHGKPICKECRWFSETENANGDGPICLHESAVDVDEDDIVLGELGNRDCYDMRYEGACGEDGKLWEARGGK